MEAPEAPDEPDLPSMIEELKGLLPEREFRGGLRRILGKYYANSRSNGRHVVTLDGSPYAKFVPISELGAPGDHHEGRDEPTWLNK